MTKHRKKVGSGITARIVESFAGEDIPAAFGAFAERWNAALAAGGGSTFGAVVAQHEDACRRILGAAGDGPFEADSGEDFARRIVTAIEHTRDQINCGNADEAAREALFVGKLITEANIKRLWESHALRGKGNAERLVAVASEGNRRRKREAAANAAQWQAMADRMRAKNPRLTNSDIARHIEAKTGDKFDKVRRAIVRK